MRLSDLEDLALRYNPTIAQATAAIAMQQGTWQQAGLYPNPQVGYVRTDASNPTQSQTNGFFAAQEFVTAHKLQLAQAVEARGRTFALGVASPAHARAQRLTGPLL